MTAYSLRFFLFAMSSPPIAQVVNNSGYSTCFGREVKGKHCKAIYCEIMRRRTWPIAPAQEAVLPVAGGQRCSLAA
jgi:hypothetical protein